MMPTEEYQDRILTCRDCGQEFTFTAGEQSFFASKGLTNAPSRCPECRSARRNGRNGSPSSFSPRPRGEQYEAVCAQCGNKTTVPFMPREDRPVYCSECFQSVRASRGPRRDDSSYNYSFSTGNSYDSDNSRGGGGGGGRDRRGGNGGNRRERTSRW